MTTERLAVRLDIEHKKKLHDLAERKKESISDVVRRLIDEAYEADQIEYRLRLVEEMAALNVEDVPDPDELSRQLNAKYDFTGLS